MSGEQFKLVPVEPTSEMIVAGQDAHPAQSFHIVKDVYRAMLAAAPAPAEAAPVAWAGVDSQVAVATQEAGSTWGHQPAWLWYDDREMCLSLGRWSKDSKQAAYIRADLAPPPTDAEAVRRAVRCRHDGGFDLELGHVGCHLEIQGGVCSSAAGEPPAATELVRVALNNLAHEMRYLLRNHPKMDGGLYRQRLNEAEAALSTQPPATEGWRPIETAPKDGTVVDIYAGASRHADVWWGRPHHSCGEAGHLCDSCPSYDGWCDILGYLTGEEGWIEDEPTHWQPLPAPPARGGE